MGQDEPEKDHPAIMELHELKTKLFMEIAPYAFDTFFFGFSVRPRGWGGEGGGGRGGGRNVDLARSLRQGQLGDV